MTALLITLLEPRAPRVAVPLEDWPNVLLVAVLPRCAFPLYTRPREVDAPLPLLGPVGGLPRLRPRELWPLTDDIVGSVEVCKYCRHV